MDASSASEDDLDSEDSEQEVKSCSHCGATSEFYFQFGKSSVFYSTLIIHRFLKKVFRAKISVEFRKDFKRGVTT